MMERKLHQYDNSHYNSGRHFLVRGLWYFTSVIIFESGLFPFSPLKIFLLRLFGAECGTHITIKPNTRIKYPWRLWVGDNSWIGQEVWIDNLEDVRIGANVCISQQVYLCTGSHDHNQETFDLIVKPIIVEDGVWIAARAMILPGVIVGRQAVVCAASVVTKSVSIGDSVAGIPAVSVRD